jgi:hypothetical protein
MRIHAVSGGFEGNGAIQYVELRMDAGGQSFVGGHTIHFYDGANALKATFTFPSGVANSNLGESILIGTSEFNASASGGDADFTFNGSNTIGSNGGDPLHPVQTPGGRVHFAAGSDNCDPGGIAGAGEADSVAYGTAAAHFGTAAAALPSPATDAALRVGNLNTTPTDNSTEYSLQGVSTAVFAVAPANLATDLTTPRNNGRTVLQLIPLSVGGVASDPGLEDANLATPAGRDDSSVSSWVLGIGGIAALSLVVVAGARALVRARR